MLVKDAGHRERQALLKWWDATECKIPCWKLLGEVQYDAHLDALIFPDGTEITIQAINELEGGYGTLRGKTTL
jgi:hypothetical protein